MRVHYNSIMDICSIAYTNEEVAKGKLFRLLLGAIQL